jgi:diguanylate cyclase (GGDEF)-like protein
LEAKQTKVARINEAIALDNMVKSETSFIDAETITEKLPVGILVCSLNGINNIDVHYLNAFAANIFEFPDSKRQFPIVLQTLWPNEDNYSLANHIQDAIQLNKRSTFEWRIKLQGATHFLSSQLIPLKSEDGKTRQVICTIEDQTAEKMAEKNLLHHAFHDSLTGQPNRVLFRNRLEDAVNECERSENNISCAVFIINIDRFQQVNESFGHSAGDRFLIAMAATLRRCISSSDILARLSGDEFAIMIPEFESIDEIKIISDRIHDAIKAPYDLDGNEIYTSVSIGIATTLSSDSHPEDLIRDADFAMHQAKSAGKARSEIYHRASHHRARSQFHLETELRRALERKDLELYYQPIVDFRTGSIIALEALTRWNHKDRGFVSPVEFIPLAEETNLIVELGRWALDEACSQIKTWGDIAVPVNVNVSGVQFARDDVKAIVRDTLDHHKVGGEMIRIELTESAIMANPTVISESLQYIRDKGIKIALDDFGTGYSSLNYLHQFPLDVIKIDRSFINKLEWDNDPYKILQMISMLAHNLGLETVAEGLEDPEHLAMLRGMNFDYGQGYYYSPPLPPSELTPMLVEARNWKK